VGRESRESSNTNKKERLKPDEKKDIKNALNKIADRLGNIGAVYWRRGNIRARRVFGKTPFTGVGEGGKNSVCVLCLEDGLPGNKTQL